MSCKYCVEAFTDMWEEDVFADPITSKQVLILGGGIDFQMLITPFGELAFKSVPDARVDLYILKRKIKFCPMCGAQIPKVTVNDKRRKENE